MEARNCRVRLVQLTLGIVLLGAATASTAAPACAGWDEWERFKATFVKEGGRVVDLGDKTKRTVSEGQAYALFFALVANDRQAFERILTWTEDNLAQGDLTAHLPAWHWGRRGDGTWGVLDSNPASDADLWLAYTLAEAGRLWNDRRFTALATLIANRILREETRSLPDLGPTLLPAPKGFYLREGVWRLNPSYVPLQLLRRMSRLHPDSHWPKVAESSLRLIVESAPKGFSPDWVVYDRSRGFLPDPDTSGEGSYDAIRVYLWAGMLNSKDPASRRLTDALAPMASYVAAQGIPPEKVDTASGTARTAGPVGFSSAVLPLLATRGLSDAVNDQLARLQSRPPAPEAYYDNVLTLFSLGWHEGHYRFEEDGTVLLRWQRECAQESPAISSKGG